jgi:hypothetical protein
MLNVSPLNYFSSDGRPPVVSFQRLSDNLTTHSNVEREPVISLLINDMDLKNIFFSCERMNTNVRVLPGAAAAVSVILEIEYIDQPKMTQQYLLQQPAYLANV